MKIETVRENRIFQRAYKKGRKYAGKYAVIYALPGKAQIPSRLGLTVTKGRGCAVVRSRIRRVLRAAYRDVCAHRGVPFGHDIIIVARDACVDAKSTDVAVDLERGMDRLSLLEDAAP